MRLVLLTAAVALFMLTLACGSQSKSADKTQSAVLKNSKGINPNIKISEIQDLSVSGKVVQVKTGKDGYTATIKDGNGNHYHATISAVNLQQSSTPYKRFEVGDDVSVKGSFWHDQEGQTYVTVKDILGDINTEKEHAVKGKITAIEKGKDGYTATLKDASGTTYKATISMVNLQKYGGTFKRYDVGDTIWIKGSVWEDPTGAKYITVKELKDAE